MNKITTSVVILLFMIAQPVFAQVSDTLTTVEKNVQARLVTDGLHVVHFWAPWCGNAEAELRAGWYQVIEEHPEVDFIFVGIWDDENAGRDKLTRFGIPDSITAWALPDYGPSDVRANRRREFLNLPLQWSPSTWIFYDNGKLAYAFNYGELEMDALRKAIADLKKDWSHD